MLEVPNLTEIMNARPDLTFLLLLVCPYPPESVTFSGLLISAETAVLLASIAVAAVLDEATAAIAVWDDATAAIAVWDDATAAIAVEDETTALSAVLFPMIAVIAV